MTSQNDVTVSVDRDSVAATGIVDAPAAAVFDVLRRPVNHHAISGDGTVRGTLDGPEVLELGSRFGMKMRLGVPYRIHSKVVEFEQDRKIAWAHFGGHRWSWTLEPTDDGRTRVTERFDMSTAKFPPALRLMGYPARHRDNVARSVANLAAIVAGETPSTSG